MSPLKPIHGTTGASRGLTLVELMVALAISLTLVVAASMLFLNTRFSQRATDERGQLQETGQMVLELLGSQIGNAGFYPMINVEAGSATGADTTAASPSYRNSIKNITNNVIPSALASGIYGCADGIVKDDLSGCDANEVNVNPDGSDSLALSYFTGDAMSIDLGSRADCTRSDVGNDNTYNNVGRVGSFTVIKTGADGAQTSTSKSRGQEDLGLPPLQPMLGINIFQLQNFSYVDDSGRTVNTFALTCRGNGNGLNAVVVLVPGVEQLTLRYGVVNDTSWTPARYLTGSEVSALTSKVMDGDAIAPKLLEKWDLVVTVRVCVLVRSLNPGAARVTSSSITDCNGNAYTPAPGTTAQTFTQLFGVKNKLKQTVGL
jgi:type IV pilus assembly protein PilW